MSMHFTQAVGPRPETYVVTCKLCRRSIPTGRRRTHSGDAYPRDNIVVECPLCGEVRRYRPSEVFLGWPDSLLAGQVATVRHRPHLRKPPRRQE